MLINLFKKTDLKASFWKWFSNKENELYLNFEENKDHYMDEISERLNAIDPNLTFEIGTINDEVKRQFIISADGIADSFESVENLCNAAPAYSNWITVKFRPRMSSENIEISMGDVELSYDDIYFIHENHRHYVDLKIYIRNYDSKDNRYDFSYFILLDSLVGEYDAVAKIGDTSFYPLTNDIRERAKKFVELTSIVDELQN
ncbi:hypothetical protein KZ483_02165 [Paenibacillus sp. sptzw28]|uniref:hypothetical protein n=1 Tax=Paenibacillus sp. sptzw28 TaxID=715179 RepID=UPI001C6DF01F|nr:hypothetical protein [Paenibacillus sp. sptzw28]QYR21869.1 hypothetical protein KZ483_02165 [Paenibacillus sp. sptzw28]